MAITICPDCDGQKLMPGYDCDCPTCDASGSVSLKSHVGYSRENECHFVRFFPFGSEAHAKAFEERIHTTVPAPSEAVAWRYRRKGRQDWHVTDYLNPSTDLDVWEVEPLGVLPMNREAR